MAVNLMNVLQQFLLPLITIPLLNVHSKSLEDGLSFDEEVFTFLTLEEGLCSVGKTVEDIFLIIGCDSDFLEINNTEGRHNDNYRQQAQCLVRPSEKKDINSFGGTHSLFRIFVHLSDTCGSLIDERIENSSSHICVSLTNVADICKQKSNVTLNVTSYLDKGQGYGFPFTTVKVVIKTPITSTTKSTTERNALVVSRSYGLSPLLLVGTGVVDCSFDQNCRWTDSNGELKVWPTTQKVKCDYCNRLSSSEQFGYWNIRGKTTLSSPYILGSLKRCSLIFESNVIGNASLSVWLVQEDNSTLLEPDRIDPEVWKSHYYFIGEQRRVFEIHLVIKIKDDNSFLALRNLKFSRYGSSKDDTDALTNTSPLEQTTINNYQDSLRECNFNEPCTLIRQKSNDCELKLEKEDPMQSFSGGVLFSSSDECKERNDAWFQTITFQPQQKNSPDEECKIAFSIYGKAMWTLSLCEDTHCKIMLAKRDLKDPYGLKTYEITINDVRNEWFLKFKTKYLNRMYYLGIKSLTASSACFGDYDTVVRTNTISELEQTTGNSGVVVRRNIISPLEQTKGNNDTDARTNTIPPLEQTPRNNRQNMWRECIFNESCKLIRQISSDCPMEIEKEDPNDRYPGGVLFSSGGECKRRGRNASFETILFQPQPENLPDEECKISFSIYGKAMWILWLCEDEHCTKRVKEKRDLQGSDILKTYEMTIKDVRNEWFLKFETKELYRSHYLGIKKLTASNACFNEYELDDMTSTTNSLEQTTRNTTDWLISPDDTGDNYKLVIIPVALLCLLLVMLIILIGINRRKLTQFQICRGSRKIKDRDMSISELLTMSHNGKTLDHILTEGNPNYNWFQHKFQHGYIRFYDRSRININNVLGKGAFGEVYKGTLLKVSNREKNIDVAIKKLSSESIEKDENNFLMEAFTLCKFNHKNIVRCLGISSDKGQFIILLELMVGGDLKSFLRCTRDNLTQRPTLKVEELIRLGLDIASGCCYLESNKYVHRDIAARNCLLTTHGTNRIAKIADFGLARDIVMKEYYKKEGRALLPIRWMPPEAYQDGLFTVKSDVWAFGILLWEIFTSGFIPYPGLSNDSVMSFVSRGGRLDSPGVCPQEIYDLMLQCWSCLQNDRPTFPKILQKLTMTLKNTSDWDQNVEEDLEKPSISLKSTQYYVKQLCQEEASPLM